MPAIRLNKNRARVISTFALFVLLYTYSGFCRLVMTMTSAVATSMISVSAAMVTVASPGIAMAAVKAAVPSARAAKVMTTGAAVISHAAVMVTPPVIGIPCVVTVTDNYLIMTAAVIDVMGTVIIMP